MPDPRDSIVPGVKEWEEFRASLAAAVLNAWMLSELDLVAPHYFSELKARFEDGFGNAEQFLKDDSTYDGAVPIQWPAGGVTFFDKALANELFDVLFPHYDSEGDFRFMAWGLAVVAVQSALEVFAKSRGVDPSGGLTIAIRKHIREATGQDLDAATAELLTDCEATRHLFVHNRGIVDDAYVRRVSNCQRVRGDRRDVDLSAVTKFAQASRLVASLIRDLGKHE